MLDEVHQVLPLVMMDNITIIQMRTNIDFIGKVQGLMGYISGQVFQEAEALCCFGLIFRDMFGKV